MSRFLDLMASGGLSDQRLARARRRAAQDAAFDGEIVDSLGNAGSSLVGGGLGALKAIGKRKGEEAEAAADATIAQHLADVGTENDGPAQEGAGPSYSDSAGDVAKRATQSLEAKHAGILDRALSALVGEDTAKALAKARAEKAVASQVMQNRRTARADSIAEQQAGVAAGNRDVEREKENRAEGRADTATALGYLPHLVSAGIEEAKDPETLATEIGAMPTFAAVPRDVLRGLVVAEQQKQKRARIATENKADLDEQTAQALAAERQARAAKAARGGAPQAGGVPSLKDQLTKARIDALNAKTAAGPSGTKKPSGGGAKLNVNAMQLEVQHAKELADLYDAGNMNPMGGKMPKALHSDDRIKAAQIAHSLALAVPSAFSGSSRLNRQEFEAALKDIIGDPDSVDTNANKALRARNLATMLQEAVDAQRGAPAATTTAPSAATMDASRAKAVYNAMNPAQQEQVKALIDSGVDRVAAVQHVTGGF